MEHTWNTHGTNKGLGHNLDETPSAVSFVVNDGSVYLFESETDYTYTCVGGGVWSPLMMLASSLPLCGTLCQWLLF